MVQSGRRYVVLHSASISLQLIYDLEGNNLDITQAPNRLTQFISYNTMGTKCIT